GERFLAHVDARLVLAALQQIDRQLPERLLRPPRRIGGLALLKPGRWRVAGVVRRDGRTRGCRAEQDLEASPETSPLDHVARTPSLRISKWKPKGSPRRCHVVAGASVPGAFAASRRLISPASAR